MHLRIAIYNILFVCMVGQLTAQYDQAISSADKIAQQLYDSDQLPGLAIGVSIGGNDVWLSTYGYADLENETEIDPASTQFRVGSVSKTMTAMGLMLLVEEGKIDLDDEIYAYVPEFSNKGYPVTVEQVAKHVAGIRHYRGMEFMSNVHYPDVASGMSIFANDSLMFEPGTNYSYSSYGWNLISRAMETASNEEFLAFMHDRVFAPLDMKNTEAEFTTEENEHLVSFYDEGRKPSMPVDNSYKWAGGGFISTLTDMLTFGDAILTNSLISSDTKEVALETYTLKDGSVTNRGVGFEVQTDKKGRSWYGHSGGSVGGTTMLLIYPEQSLIVVTLCNQGSAGTVNLAFRVAEQFLARMEGGNE